LTVIAIRREDAKPLAWRIFLVNVTVFAVGAAALALSPATVSWPIALAEAVVLAVGLTVTLLVNLLLVQRSLAPLERLAGVMHDVDLLRPGQRLEVTGTAEVRELGSVFNQMLDRLERERQESGWDAVQGQEDERKHVAQELHDEVGQALTAVMLQLSRLAKRAPAELENELREVQETTRASLDDVRRIARQLRPEALDDLGLASALSALATTFAERTGLRVYRRVDEELPALPPEAELALFRVAQESLTNAARHSGTSRVELWLESGADGVLLRVRDHGRGIDGARPRSGIRGMRERALLIGERTDGSTGQPVFLQFENGMQAWVSTRRHSFPDGSPFEGVGITPDVEVIPTPEDVRTGRDAVLQHAITTATTRIGL
jgi:two-component system, NarL family, sensor histidine kinase UhpB